MHIPDGLIGTNPFASHVAEHSHEHAHDLLEHAVGAPTLIDPNIQLLIYAIIAIVILAVVYKSKDKLTEKDVPKIGLFIVAVVIIQMIELPLPVAACVHISLITVLALYDLNISIIVYTFVTIIQGLLLGEGGVSTMGVNLLNLAIFGPIIAYGLYNLLSKINKTLALFISGFGTITLLGLIVGIEYALAGTFPLSYGITVITPVEAVVGILEGFITVILMNALNKVKPELVPVMSEQN